MSLELISRSSDLKRLRDEGYEVEVSNNAYLVISHVPYVSAKDKVSYGKLISKLDLSGDVTAKPSDHVAFWAGEYPCDSKGSQMSKLVNNTGLNEKVKDGLVATISFSHKPGPSGYDDYHQKMTTYSRILEGEARALDSSATSRTFAPVELSEAESVLCYLDSASSRAGITAINNKLKKGRIAIVGLGGTGAYILDLVAKTPVGEIHLFDGDNFLQHNAFRSPGAPSIEDLRKRPTKVAWLEANYSRMRRKIFSHPKFIDETNVGELKSMDFVFVCLDKGAPKKTILSYLFESKIPFIDVGMDLFAESEMLGGSARVTTYTQAYSDHLSRRINFTDGEEDLYSQNIQVADMNALNAALAVIKWKKLWGFYVDLQNEHNAIYGVSTDTLTNDEIPNEAANDQTQVR
jgi:hypothetical protein